jgi:hypothetical protein
LALTIGILLAVGALAFVLYPLFSGVRFRPLRAPERAKQEAGAAERDAVSALREIDFDHATGKLSDSDYGDLHARYAERALHAMRDGSANAVTDDPVEAVVRAYRAQVEQCITCGMRPEPEAIYCSNCGRYLPGACGFCGSAVNEPNAAFCGACGRQLVK